MTGLKLNLSPIKVGNLNMQAVQSQANTENEETPPIVVGKSSIATNNGFPIFQAQTLPSSNKFTQVQSTLPSLNTVFPLSPFGLNSFPISPLTLSFNPIKLKGISNQRPEILCLTDYNSVFADESGFLLSDTGDFIGMSIASRELRFEHVKTLIESLEETEDADKILTAIGKDYLREIDGARNSVSFMTSIFEKIKNLKRSFDIKKDDYLVNNNYANEIVVSKRYKDFLVDDFGFSENGFLNFSSTKVFGQFLFDSKGVLDQYSPSLFGKDKTPSPQIGNLNFSLGLPGANNVTRNNDRDFGKFINEEIDITDGSFQFNIELLRNIDFSLVGTPFGQFLDLLPSEADDRVKMLIAILSKEFRVSRGLGDSKVTDIILNTFGGDDTGNPFEFIFGQPGSKITDPVIGSNSLCSLLRFQDSKNQTILPFENVYVRDESQRLYIPGSHAFVDTILEGEEPFSLDALSAYQKRFEKISSDAVTVVESLLDLSATKRKLKPHHLFGEIVEDIIECSEKVLSNQAQQTFVDQIVYPGSWGEIAILKAATTDREVKHLLFQYILALGFIGKPSSKFANTSVPNFFKEMSEKEIVKYKDLPEIKKSNSLNSQAASLGLLAALGNEQVDNIDVSNIFSADDIQNVDTTDRDAGYTALAFISKSIVDKIRDNNQNASVTGNSSVRTSTLFTHLITGRKLVILNRIVDFISSLDVQAGEKIYFDDEGKRTRFNRLNRTTIALMAFEAYLAFVEKYFDGISEPSISPEGETGNDKLFFLGSPIKIQNFIRRLKKVRKSGPVESGIGGLAFGDDSFYTSIFDIKRKLEGEATLTRQIVSRLQRTTERVNSAYSDAADFFRVDDGPNARKFEELLEGVDGKEKVSMINEGQFILARKALDDLDTGEGLSMITTRTPGRSSGLFRGTSGNKGTTRRRKKIFRRSKKTKRSPVFLDRSIISENERKIMNLVFNLPQYRPSKSSNLKILSVGIPSGFSTNFENEISVNSETFNSIGEKEKDVISINVYRKSIEFEEIVFKPIPYIYELSRFVSRSSLNSLDVQKGFNPDALSILGVNFMKDFSRKSKGKGDNFSSVLLNPDYSFLTQEQKFKMVFNHLTSYVLELYIKLTTGISLDESEYLVNDDLLNGMIDSESQNRFKTLIETYVQGISGQALTIEQLKSSSPQISDLLEKIDTFRLNTNFTEQITPPTFPGVSRSASVEITEDLINFIKLYSPKSLLTGGKSQAARIVSPKIFERIINIPVDPDLFEIDLEKTVSTVSGARMYALLQKRNLLSSPTKIKERNLKNDVQFDQFFVTISTIVGGVI